MTFEKHLHVDGVVHYNITLGERSWRCSRKPGQGWRMWSNIKGEYKELEAHELRTFRLMIVGDVRAVMMECADLSNALLDGIEAKP